jgi:catechol-2,3-dioxygenase
VIKGLYETHLAVENLQRSVAFYKYTLGLTQCSYDDGRKICFFWVGEPQQYMLGLWETPKVDIRPQHFAFRCDKDFILNESVSWLKKRGLQPYNFLKDGTEQPMVFAWMPALAIYFKDPDGHILEFIAILEGNPIPEGGILSYEEWEKVSKSENQ